MNVTYTIGQQVENPNHGTGIITAIDGQFLVIDFGTNGVKRVFAAMFREGAYAPTQVAAPAKHSLSVSDLAQTIWASTGIWQDGMQDFAERVSAAASGNSTMSDIIAKWRRSHRASQAQASAIARFAISKNITL